MDSTLRCHETWHKLYKWLSKTYGKDLYSEWRYIELSSGKKLKWRDFNDYELSKRLVGVNVIEKVEKYIRKNIPEIKVITCDDTSYTGSLILLVPHPSHGITFLYIPQSTSIQNHFFLYEGHYQSLIRALFAMRCVYNLEECGPSCIPFNMYKNGKGSSL